MITLYKNKENNYIFSRDENVFSMTFSDPCEYLLHTINYEINFPFKIIIDQDELVEVCTFDTDSKIIIFQQLKEKCPEMFL